MSISRPIMIMRLLRHIDYSLTVLRQIAQRLVGSYLLWVCHYITLYFRNGTCWRQSYYTTWRWSDMLSIEWCHYSFPMTLNDPDLGSRTTILFRGEYLKAAYCVIAIHAIQYMPLTILLRQPSLLLTLVVEPTVCLLFQQTFDRLWLRSFMMSWIHVGEWVCTVSDLVCVPRRIWLTADMYPALSACTPHDKCLLDSQNILYRPCRDLQ